MQDGDEVIKAFALKEANDFARECHALAALRDSPLPVARLIASGSHEMGHWVRMSKLPGATPPCLDGHYEYDLHCAAGALAGQLHSHTSQGKPRAPETIWSELYSVVHRTDFERALRDQVLEQAKVWEEEVSQRRRVKSCLVHGDWGPGQMLVDSGGNAVGMVDWEDTHYGDPVDDLAWTAVPGFETEYLRCFLRGYQRYASLGEAAAERLALVAIRTLADGTTWNLPEPDAQRFKAGCLRMFQSVVDGHLPSGL